MNIDSDIRKRITRYDIALVVFLLLVCAALFAVSFFEGGDSLKAEISLNGEVVHTVYLETVKESYIYNANGCEICISKDGAKFLKSPCEDALCVKTGLLSKNGEAMACVPQRVVLSIKNDKDNNFDAVVY